MQTINQTHLVRFCFFIIKYQKDESHSYKRIYTYNITTICVYNISKRTPLNWRHCGVFRVCGWRLRFMSNKLSGSFLEIHTYILMAQRKTRHHACWPNTRITCTQYVVESIFHTFCVFMSIMRYSGAYFSYTEFIQCIWRVGGRHI